MSRPTDKAVIDRPAGSGKKLSISRAIRQIPVEESLRKSRAGKVPKQPALAITYRPKSGVAKYMQRVAGATPMELVQTERFGVDARLIKDLSKHMGIPAARIFNLLGLPKATAEKKAAAGETVAGQGGQAAIGVVRLLGIAQEIVAKSTSREARGFDYAKWLGQWIEVNQAALGGRKPAEFLDTPTGVEIVARLLGSIQSGAYQ
jgi:putative toxin-antitoxin system antitoxin component (TIGR02293 family)